MKKIINYILSLLRQTEGMLAYHGGTYISATVPLAGGTSEDNYAYIVINEDTVFSAIVDIADNDVLDEWNIAANTITRGMVIGAQSGLPLKTVTIVSGSSLGIKGKKG
tara:strand:+ start:189 stop:512 length:324 start_codon:yes stop_codon:yes gene_type:complete